MEILKENLYDTTLSDLIAAGATHLAVRCPCGRGQRLPLRLSAWPCGASVEKLTKQLKCQCGRKEAVAQGINHADHVPKGNFSTWGMVAGGAGTLAAGVAEPATVEALTELE